MRRLFALLLTLSLFGCAHSKQSAVESLRTTVEGFHRSVRWKDYRAAARFLVPEHREAFQEARERLNDEKDLSITDYEIEELRVAEDARSATVISRVQWMRLPSASEHTATVTSEFIFRDGAWLLERQRKGPFEGELP